MDKVFLERPSVNEVLREKIKKYKKAHSRLSSNQIARRLGLPPSTFHRLEMGDVKSPGLDICVTVLNGLCTKQETAEFVGEYFPEVHESLFSHFISTNNLEKLDQSLERFFQDESTYRLMVFATTKAGLSENYVLQEYGRSGHKVFMKLAADGVLKNENGRFFYSKENVFLAESAGAKLTSLVYDELYNEINVNGSHKGTLFETCFESVDKKKVTNELVEISNEYMYKVKQVLLKPENRGEDVFFISNMVRRLV